MRNFKKETISRVSKLNLSNIKSMYFRLVHYNLDDELNFVWNSSLSEETLEEFMNEYMDFEYNNGYGTQYIEGHILMNDGSWFQRHEYDGLEHWKYYKYDTTKTDSLDDHNVKNLSKNDIQEIMKNLPN